MRRVNLTGTRKLLAMLAMAVALLPAPGCLLRRETRIRPSQLPPPAREASLSDLVAKLDSRSHDVNTLTATVDLQPTAGSVYSGVIKEYQDVRGFILAERPASIRVLGQAPLLRTDIFDMVSNGQEFRLNIPSAAKVHCREDRFPPSREELPGEPAAPAHPGGVDDSGAGSLARQVDAGG